MRANTEDFTIGLRGSTYYLFNNNKRAQIWQNKRGLYHRPKEDLQKLKDEVTTNGFTFEMEG